MSEFIPPKVDLGDTVIYYRKGDPRQAYPAVVTEVFPMVITCNTYGHNRRDFTIERSIRHKDDPALINTNLKDNGTWDLTPTTR